MSRGERIDNGGTNFTRFFFPLLSDPGYATSNLRRVMLATDNESVRECQSWNQLRLDAYPICIYIGGSIGILHGEILSLIVDGESILIDDSLGLRE